MDVDIEHLQALTHLSDTGLLTLFARAADSRAGGAIHDPTAERLVDALIPVLAGSDRPLHKRLARRAVSRPLAAYMGLRARYFDDRAVEFLARRREPVIVNLGCGLDSRFQRLRARVADPSALELIDVDLPAVITVKQRVLPPEPGYRQLAADVTEPSFLGELPLARPMLLLAEGLLMYLPEPAVRALVLELHTRSPGCELVAEVFNRRWLEGWRGRMVSRKLEGEFDLDASARFQFGIADARELEGWAEGIETLGEWSFLDERSPRMFGANWMRHFDGLRRLQWVVHWRLG